LLGFWQEKGAADAFEKLLALRCRFERQCSGTAGERKFLVEEIVPGDVIILSAGDIIPADCLILDSKDLFVSEATLTGETYPVEKLAGTLKTETSLAQAYKFSLDGNQCGQWEWKSTGSIYRKGNRVWENLRDAKTQAPGN
jgi:Mg2+-importing ATPase